MKYRKKPVVIEAVQFLELDANGKAVFDCDTADHDGPMWLWGNWQNGTISYSGVNSLLIKTLEGDHIASIGDYIIRGINGELYPCKPEIFSKTYEPV